MYAFHFEVNPTHQAEKREPKVKLWLIFSFYIPNRQQYI